jgi:ribose transport system substrate-binding protein
VLACLVIGVMPALAQEPSELPSESPGTATASTTIGFTNFYGGADFFGEIESGAQEAADAAGVTFLAEDAYGDPSMQANQVEAFITDGVSAIIIVPIDPDAIVPSVEAANAAGIPVLAVDRTANGGTVASLIASDNVAAGRMAGEALFSVMGGSGKVIEIQGDMAVSSGSERSEGFQQALDAAPDITRVLQESAFFDYGLASQITQRGLAEDPDIAGVFASNLDMLEGAAEGVAAGDKQGQVRVVGFDTDPVILDMIMDGSIDATVAQQPRLMGQKAVEAALAAAAGEPVDAFIPIKTILVTADSVNQFLAGEAVAAEAAQDEAASMAPEAEVVPSEEPDEAVTWPQFTGDIVYGEDDSLRQVIHVLQPEPREAPRPAVVFFHGGGLVYGEPLQDRAWAQAIAEQGYVTFLAGYRLFGQFDGANPWPAQLDDAQRAIRWVRAHADDFNVDPERVCAIGHSSGGHLAGLVGTTESTDTSDPALAGISSRVDCAVTVSGDADLMVPYATSQWTNVFNGMFGGTVEEVPEIWQAASPAYNIDEDTVPFLIIHGNRDRDVPVEMARNLADALAEAGKEFVYAEVPAGHMDIGTPEATGMLQDTFLAYQLHPEE